jgi:hypothetical protein
MTKITFIQRPIEMIRYMNRFKFTASERALYDYLSILDPFGDRLIRLPAFEAIALELDYCVETIKRSLRRISDLSLIVLDDTGFYFRNGVKNIKNAIASRIRTLPEVLDPQQKCQQKDLNDRDETFLSTDSQKCQNQPLEATPDIASDLSQTLQALQTIQTGGGLDLLINKDSQAEQVKIEESKNKNEESEKVPKEGDRKDTISANVVSKLSKIPEELVKRLEAAEIPLDDRVIKAIESHDISQAYGAITHIENTWETIEKPRSVFLYQIPKQPIEKLGARYDPEESKKYIQKLEEIKAEKESPEGKEAAKKGFSKIKEMLEANRRKGFGKIRQ